MRFCIISVSLPWFFGPYAQQAAIVADEMLNRNHNVYWFGVPYQVLDQARTYKWQALRKAAHIASSPKTDAELKLAKRLTFLAMTPQPRGKFLVAEMNRVLTANRIDTVLALMDMDRFERGVGAASLAVTRSIAWYPNHFPVLDADFANALAAFTDVASLCPTDGAMIKAALAPVGVNVSVVPHAILTPPVLAESAAAAWDDVVAATNTRAQLREKWRVPADAFCVLINIANYDPSDRKALDVSLMAFRNLRQAVGERAFLYLHAIDARHVVMQEKRVADPRQINVGELSLAALFHAVSLPVRLTVAPTLNHRYYRYPILTSPILTTWF